MGGTWCQRRNRPDRAHAVGRDGAAPAEIPRLQIRITPACPCCGDRIPQFDPRPATHRLLTAHHPVVAQATPRRSRRRQDPDGSRSIVQI